MVVVVIMTRTFNKNIIYSSNYEICRSKKIPFIRPNDLVIYGVSLYTFAPKKRRINNKQRRIGRNYLGYNNNSHCFFVDNKLKVVNLISNRCFVPQILVFCHFNGKKIKIENKHGLSIELIINTFLQICQEQKWPHNIFTDNEFICELFHYLLSSNFFPYPHKDIKICHVLNSTFHSRKDVFHKLNTKKYKCKTRMVCNSDDHENAMVNAATFLIKNSYESNNNEYNLKEQLVCIQDCLIDSYPQINITIGKEHIQNKSYFINCKSKKEKYEDVNFIYDKYGKIIRDSINKYFMI